MLKTTFIKKEFWIISILIVVCFGIYANTIQNDFVWDDRTLFIVNYDRWQWKNIKELISRPDNLFGVNENPFYRPLPNLTYLIDRYIWGRNASGYHLFNILFHTFSTITVFYVARSLLGNFYASAATSLLFAVHPIHTEVVAWVNGRNNAIAGFFYLLAFYNYIRYRTLGFKKALLFSLIAFTCSLFSKEYALTFPIVMLLYELSYAKNRFKFGSLLTHMAKLWLPYLLLIILFLFIRSLLLPTFGAIPLHMDMLFERILTVPKTVLLYLRFLILPLGLTPLHDISFIEHPWNFAFIFPFLALTTILLFWLTRYHKSNTVFFGMGWIFITLMPVMNIIPLSNTTTFFAERYLYLPCFGFCLLVGNLLMTFFKSKDRPIKPRVYVAIFLLVVTVEAFGFETVKRNLVWRNELTLWKDAVIKSPNSFMVRTNLALALFEKGRVDDAHKEINEAIRLFPNHDTPYYILGVILYDKGSFDKSIKALDKTLQINPRHTDATNLLAKIQKKRLNPKEKSPKN